MAKKKDGNSESGNELNGGSAEDDALFVPHLDDLEIRLESNGDTYAALVESICGIADDSQPVEQYNGALGVTAAFVGAHQGAVCQVQWNSNLASIYTNPGNVSGVRWGTGTMISDDIMITCGHLFDQTGGGWNRPRVNGTSNIISPQDIARNMRCNFNYQVDASGVLRAEQSFAILELIEYRLGGIDMAICRVAGNPGATFGRTAVSSTDAASPDMLCIIGHPAGLPKRIEAGPTTAIDGNLIRYNDIDTLGGNSGSGILRASDGRLVGIHTNGGCTNASPGPSGGSNFGVRIEAFIAASPTVQALLRPKLKVLDDGAGPKVKVLDDTPPKRKLLDDGVGPKIKVLDDGVGPKRKLLDDAPPKRKVLDDVKVPALDKAPGGEHKSLGFDNPGVFDPGRVVNPGVLGRNVRPFVLETPHHAAAWQSGGEAAQQGVEAQLAELEAALATLAQAIASARGEVAALDAQYQSLLAHYEALASGG